MATPRHCFWHRKNGGGKKKQLKIERNKKTLLANRGRECTCWNPLDSIEPLFLCFLKFHRWFILAIDTKWEKRNNSDVNFSVDPSFSQSKRWFVHFSLNFRVCFFTRFVFFRPPLKKNLQECKVSTSKHIHLPLNTCFSFPPCLYVVFHVTLGWNFSSVTASRASNSWFHFSKIFLFNFLKTRWILWVMVLKKEMRKPDLDDEYSSNVDSSFFRVQRAPHVKPDGHAWGAGGRVQHTHRTQRNYGRLGPVEIELPSFLVVIIPFSHVLSTVIWHETLLNV